MNLQAGAGDEQREPHAATLAFKVHAPRCAVSLALAVGGVEPAQGPWEASAQGQRAHRVVVPALHALRAGPTRD